MKIKIIAMSIGIFITLFSNGLKLKENNVNQDFNGNAIMEENLNISDENVVNNTVNEENITVQEIQQNKKNEESKIIKSNLGNNPKKVETIEKNDNTKSVKQEIIKPNIEVKQEKTNENITQEDNNTEEAKEIKNKEVKLAEEVTKTQIPKCTDVKHGIGCGNSNKWFSTYSEAISYYDNLIKDYSDRVKNNKITKDDYYKQCPCGYETWSCPYCGKWTLNFYYR